MQAFMEQLEANPPKDMGEAFQLFNKAFEYFVGSHNQETLESNELIDELEAKDKEISYLTGQVKNLTEACARITSEYDEAAKTLKDYEVSADKVTKNAEKHIQLVEQYKRERDQHIRKADDLNTQLKAFKEIAATPKKIREKIKTLQANVIKHQEGKEVQKKNFLQERKDHSVTKDKLSKALHKLAVSKINQVYSDDNDTLSLFPYQLGEGIEGYEAGQFPLLYMNKCGRGGLMLLNEDGEAELAKSPKGGLKPKASTIEHCNILLRRFKAQGYQLTNEDVEAIAQGSNL